MLSCAEKITDFEEIQAYEQGTPQWLELRRKKIGGSDIAKILGISPYGTAYSLFLEKTGRKEVKLNPAMAAGSFHEKEIREWYEQQIDEVFLTSVIVPEAPAFAIASLDGISLDRQKILECKLCNKDVFAEAKKGIAVPHYYAQCQWQLMCVPEAREVHYVCKNSKNYTAVIVKRDEEFISKMLTAAKPFYEEHLLKDIPPEMSEKDYVVIEDENAVDIAQDLCCTMEQLNKLSKLQKELKIQLIEKTDDGNSIIGPIRLTKSHPEIVDYKRACEDNEIDILKYKTQTVRWTPRRLA